MRLFPLFLAICAYIFGHVAAFAQISTVQNLTPIKYGTGHPLHYRIADFDPRLNITHQQMIEISKQAAAIWEKDTGQNYFVYDPNAEFSIHLVMDQRQIRSLKRSENLQQLEQQQQIWLNKNKQLQELKRQFAFSAAHLESMQHENSMETLIYQQHLEQHQQLTQQLDLQTQKSKQLYQKLTQAIEQFNQTFAPQVLHKGQFQGKQIFIYEFSSIDDLRLTLAHEFGHALGLKHTQDPQSLMYPRIKLQDAKNFKLTDTDLALLGLSH
ncbi:matrixin family metalloprotease [Acinetobacter haemolyticus]|uniref:matrixin family metalloprotease n=1 Tax=Acinetobacter haemolyticus TaxID=29430 RepID=UPI000D69D9B8|nr:matrixin family metalloprotease [Acinetobacter haemolyticus]